MATSQAEIAIRCRPLSAQIALWVLGGLTALFAGFSVCCLTLTAVVFPISSVLSPMIPCLVIALGVLILSGLAGVALCLDDTVRLSRAGLSLPGTIVGFFGPRNRNWQDIIQVKLLSNPRLNQSELVLFVGRDRAIRLNLDRLKQSELEQLLLAIEVWGNTTCAESLAMVKQKLLPKDNGQGQSFTELWQDELSRRFQATNFVPLEPGARVRSGELEVARQIAFGGLSAIYLVHDRGGKPYVLKELNIPATSNQKTQSEATQLFEREARILSELNHPNIVRVFDNFQENGRSYLLLEYVPGTDMHQVVAQHGPQPEDKVVAWAMLLAGLLTYLHEHDPPVIHRDLTPENIVLTDEGQLMLIDFGAANEFLGTVTGTVIGKQAYLPPEQLRGKASPASDIFALGATLYFMLTAETPEPLSELHPRTTHPGVSLELDALIHSCTAMEPDSRPASARRLYEQLATIQKSSPPLALSGTQN